MNIRLQKYKKNRLKGMNQYNAARAAGYSHSTARQSTDLENRVKQSMEDLIEQAGLTDKALIKYALKGLRAKKLSGKKGFKSPDWGSRHKFYETLLKMSGKLKMDVEINNDIKILPNIQVTFVSEKVGEKGVSSNIEDEDLRTREGSDSNRIAEQV